MSTSPLVSKLQNSNGAQVAKTQLRQALVPKTQLPKTQVPSGGVDGASTTIADQTKTQTFNLTVLVSAKGGESITARAANLQIPVVEAQTVRQALGELVLVAKRTISENASAGQVPWINPPIEPSESESRFLVPLHL